VFGRVIDGMDSVKQLRAGDSMKSVKIAESA
jgi:cyclophilin family peptidyl-prolyl cis-trans isomerase